MRWLSFVFVMALPCAAQDVPLTLPEAQRLALERSRQLTAIESSVVAAREMAGAAGRFPDPVLMLGLENVPAEDMPATVPLHPGASATGVERWSLNDDAMTMRRIGVMQEVTAKAKRESRRERFEREAEKGLAESDAARAAIRRDAALAWLDTWYWTAMAKVIAEQRVQGLQEVQAAEGEYRAGRGNQSELLLARGNLAMLDDRAAEIERRAKNARVMLGRWTGPAAERPLAGRPEITRVSLDHHDLDARVASHPEIVVLTRAQEVAAADVRIARANKVPDWSVELSYGRRGQVYGDMVSLGVRVPLPWDQASRDREVAARLAEVRRAEAQRDEALRQHVAEVRAMLHEWESNRGRIARYEREIVPLAAARAEATLGAFRGGKAGVNEVLAARRGELDARLQALQLEAETARLWAQLEFLAVEGAK